MHLHLWKQKLEINSYYHGEQDTCQHASDILGKCGKFYSNCHFQKEKEDHLKFWMKSIIHMVKNVDPNADLYQCEEFRKNFYIRELQKLKLYSTLKYDTMPCEFQIDYAPSYWPVHDKLDTIFNCFKKCEESQASLLAKGFSKCVPDMFANSFWRTSKLLI